MIDGTKVVPIREQAKRHDPSVRVPGADGRLCNRCDTWQPRSEMGKDNRAPDGMASECKVCKAKRTMIWHERTYEQRKGKIKEQRAKCYRNNPDRFRDRAFRREYGITLADYNALLSQQEGRCAICRAECQTGYNLSVDHCHTTGAIRGLLCKVCNMAIGLMKDSPERLRVAADYLEAAPAVEVKRDAA